MEYFKPFFDSLRLSDFIRPTVGITDILDILIVAFLTYKIIFWIKETRAWILFKGILVICVFSLIALLLNLNTILWLISKTISVGIIAVIIVFQPELRRALEQLGKAGPFLNLFKFETDDNQNNFTEKTIDEIKHALK